MTEIKPIEPFSPRDAIEKLGKLYLLTRQDSEACEYAEAIEAVITDLCERLHLEDDTVSVNDYAPAKSHHEGSFLRVTPSGEIGRRSSLGSYHLSRVCRFNSDLGD
jgi:hypothetical protein